MTMYLHPSMSRSIPRVVLRRAVAAARVAVLLAVRVVVAISRHEVLIMEEVESSRDWCYQCNHETLLTVTYFATPLGGESRLDTITWCEECAPVEVELEDEDR